MIYTYTHSFICMLKQIKKIITSQFSIKVQLRVTGTKQTSPKRATKSITRVQNPSHKQTVHGHKQRVLQVAQARVHSIREASSHISVPGRTLFIPAPGSSPNRYGISGFSFLHSYSIILATPSSPVDIPSILPVRVLTEFTFHSCAHTYNIRSELLPGLRGSHAISPIM